MKKRLMCMLLAMVMVLSLLPMQILAADPTHVLALGDSITAGYGLKEEENSFTDLLNRPYTVTNKAVSGYRTSHLLNQILQGELDADIAAADIITLTIGGNDLMDVLYRAAATMYNAQYDPDITAEAIVPLLGSLDQSNLQQYMPLIQCVGTLLTCEVNGAANPYYLMNTQAFADGLAAYQQALTMITANLKAKNPQAKIFVATQYNPYTAFAVHPTLAALYAGMEDGTAKLNAVIENTAAAAGYSVAPVKAAMDAAMAAGTNPYFANPDPLNLNLDFHPNAAGHAVLAEVFATVIGGAEMPDTTGAEKQFADVQASDYYYDAVLWAVEMGITTGVSADRFDPDTIGTRAQMITFLWRAAGRPAPKAEGTPFTDVDAEDYFYHAVLWAVETGITNGMDEKTFGPDLPLTRAQAAVFIFRAAQASGLAFTARTADVPFTDAPAWAYDAIEWCFANEITGGTSETTFSPDNGCTRAQMVTFIYRTLVQAQAQARAVALMYSVE